MAETKKVPGAEDQLTDIGQMLVDREGFEIGEGETIAGAARRVIGELDQRVAELEDALASSEASIRGYKSAATKAKRGSIHPLDKRAKARAVGPLGTKDAEASRELVDEAISGEVEIVASDGEKEIAELAPVMVVGAECWRAVGGGRRQLIPGFMLEPGDIAAPEVEVLGFGLFAEGEQIGWCPLVEPIAVPRLTTVRVENAIAF